MSELSNKAEQVCFAVIKTIDVVTDSFPQCKPIGDLLERLEEPICDGVAALVEAIERRHPDTESEDKACWQKIPPECPV